MGRIVNGIVSIFNKFLKDSCIVRASGLAYSSLLSIVPFITVIYAFGGFDNIGKTIVGLLLKVLVPSQQEIALNFINEFTRNSLATGTFGMIFFLLTTLLLINNIARNFDSIWGVQIETGLFRRFSTYTAVIVFGSLLLGVSMSSIESFETFINSLYSSDVINYKKTMNFFIPFVITFITFFLVLKMIPSIKIKIKSALVGSLISTILFEIVKILFKYWVLNSVKNSLIYGSLAVIPIFLVGLYLFWLIILIGVEISFFVENRTDPTNGNPSELNMEEKLIIGFDLFILIAKNYKDNFGGISFKDIESSMNLPGALLRYFINVFTESGLIQIVHNKGVRFIPGKSIDSIYLIDIANIIIGTSSRITPNSGIALENAKEFTTLGTNALSKDSILKLIKL